MKDWDVTQTRDYIAKLGFADIAKNFQAHKIDGKLLAFVGKQELIQMGVLVVGDRLLFYKEVMRIQRMAKQYERQEVIWTGEEYKQYATHISHIPHMKSAHIVSADFPRLGCVSSGTAPARVAITCRLAFPAAAASGTRHTTNEITRNMKHHKVKTGHLTPHVWFVFSLALQSSTC